MSHLDETEGCHPLKSQRAKTLRAMSPKMFTEVESDLELEDRKGKLWPGRHSVRGTEGRQY